MDNRIGDLLADLATYQTQVKKLESELAEVNVITNQMWADTGVEEDSDRSLVLGWLSGIEVLIRYQSVKALECNFHPEMILDRIAREYFVLNVSTWFECILWDFKLKGFTTVDDVVNSTTVIIEGFHPANLMSAYLMITESIWAERPKVGFEIESELRLHIDQLQKIIQAELAVI